MANTVFEQVKISGIACAVPENIERCIDHPGPLSSEEVEKFVDNTGVYERHIADDKQAPGIHLSPCCRHKTTGKTSYCRAPYRRPHETASLHSCHRPRCSKPSCSRRPRAAIAPMPRPNSCARGRTFFRSAPMPSARGARSRSTPGGTKA